jgi:hypothetical protein
MPDTEPDELTEREKAYLEGQRNVWLNILFTSCDKLGVDDPAVQWHAWVAERTEVVRLLRQICADYGDNDWPDNLYLPDVLEKHLHRYIEES